MHSFILLLVQYIQKISWGKDKLHQNNNHIQLIYSYNKMLLTSKCTIKTLNINSTHTHTHLARNKDRGFIYTSYLQPFKQVFIEKHCLMYVCMCESTWQKEYVGAFGFDAFHLYIKKPISLDYPFTCTMVVIIITLFADDTLLNITNPNSQTEL